MVENKTMKKDGFIPAARFHLLTPLFDALCSVVGLGRRYRRRIVASLNIPNGKVRVMDAGCGSGSLAIDVKRKYPHAVLYAVDADSRILTIAGKKSQEQKVQIHFREAFLQKLPFPHDSFDVVYSSLVFHHLNSEIKKEAMREIHRVLKKEGRFLMMDFGQPKNKFFSIFSWFTILFEEGYDNYQGKIPKMLSEAGFREVKEVGEHRFNIVFLKAVK